MTPWARLPRNTAPRWRPAESNGTKTQPGPCGAGYLFDGGGSRHSQAGPPGRDQLPDYWAQAAASGKVKYLDILLTKAAEKITKAGTRTATPEEGVAALVAAGVINTPDYWLANYGTFPSLGALLCALGGAVK